MSHAKPNPCSFDSFFAGKQMDAFVADRFSITNLPSSTACDEGFNAIFSHAFADS
ncbi:hypothetical protein ACFL5Z_02390 [Planctomycetota bacterium]